MCSTLRHVTSSIVTPASLPLLTWARTSSRLPMIIVSVTIWSRHDRRRLGLAAGQEELLDLLDLVAVTHSGVDLGMEVHLGRTHTADIQRVIGRRLVDLGLPVRR